ncbi:MAG TPA: DNA repair protein RadC [Chitinispirillaceae bacterium]|nr:DNA repair protein RadC [Chitinispirillaceae bacterium]
MCPEEQVIDVGAQLPVDQNDELASGISPKNPSEGHRKRLLERYQKNGIDALHDHEILELLLTFVLPRKDTKPIARTLLQRYKTIGGVINTPPEELAGVEGLGARSALMFLLVKDLISRCLNEKYQKQDVISHRRDVEEYLRFSFGNRRDEYVAIMFLDNANHIIRTEIIAEGTVNQCAVYPRIVIEKALRSGAASMILAHNHPGGSASASEADWLITERLFTVGKLLEIPLLDHVIICSHKVVSLREQSRWPR